MADTAKPFLYHLQDPINNPIDYTRNGAIGDDRAGDLEDLCAKAEDKALCCCQYRTHLFEKIYVSSINNLVMNCLYDDRLSMVYFFCNINKLRHGRTDVFFPFIGNIKYSFSMRTV